MEEVWKADVHHLHIRHDGGWRPHMVPILYKTPRRIDSSWRIRDRALACGREPQAVRTMIPRHPRPVTEIFHFGWVRESERDGRYQRYVEHDGGAFHASQHLQSIMWPDSRVRLQRKPWPQGMSAVKPILIG
jgi:hypothetical protein